MKMLKSCSSFKLSILCLCLMVIVVVSAKNNENSLNEIVDFINENRTASKLPKLYNSPGMGCMALQYISECTSNCSSNNTVSCHPSEDDITEVYAPNCGVELPTVSIISGHLVGCQWNYLTPDQAFSNVLVPNKKALSLLHSKEHTEVGIGFSGGRRGPFFWCILFSSGQTNSTFVLEGGKGIEQRTGCFSGTDQPCNASTKISFLGDSIPAILVMIFLFVIGSMFGY